MKPVDIGGDRCHLCGKSRSIYDMGTYIHYKKSGAYERDCESTLIYRCGTTVIRETRSTYDRNDGLKTEKVFEPLVRVGDKCIKP